MATLTDVSSDAKLSGRYLDDRRGVLLKASLPEENLLTHDFETLGTPVTYSANGISGAFVWKPVAGIGRHTILYDAPGSSATGLQYCSAVFKSNGTAITVDSATVAQVTSTTGLSGAATATFNTPTNTMVVVLISYDAASGDAAGDKITVTNNKSLTNVKFVERGHKEAGVNGGVAIAYIWSAAAQTGMTVTVTQTGVNATNDDLTFKVLLLGNVDTTNPVGSPVNPAKEGTSVANVTSLPADSVNITQGLAVWAANDYANLGAPTITDGTATWTVSRGTGTLTLNTTSPLSGVRDLKLAWTATGAQGVKRALNTVEQITGGRMLRIMLTISTNDPPIATVPNQVNASSNYRRLRIVLYDKLNKQITSNYLPHPNQPAYSSTTRVNWYTDFWLEPGKTLGYVEIILEEAAASKQFQIDNFKIIQPMPPKARFARKTDGGFVRGGHPSEVIGGDAYAFDDELTPGQLTEWYAEPVWDTPWKQANAFFVGAATGTVDFTIEDRATTLPSHLIKSLETPGLKLYLATNQRSVGRSREAQFVNKQLTGKPAGGISSAYSMSGDYHFAVQAVADLQLLELLLDETVLFVQPPGRYNRRPFYASVTAYSVAPVGKLDSTDFNVVISFQEVERPDTFGQPNFLENHDYAWLATQYATYADSGLTAQTYDQLGFSGVA